MNITSHRDGDRNRIWSDVTWEDSCSVPLGCALSALIWCKLVLGKLTDARRCYFIVGFGSRILFLTRVVLCCVVLASHRIASHHITSHSVLLHH